jgi:hypothetical protein
MLINIAPVCSYMLQFAQAPACVCSDANQFGVIRVVVKVVSVVRVGVEIAGAIVCDHRLISFVNEDSENDGFINK